MRLGELFAGYGGLGMGVQRVFPEAELAWYSDVCKFAKDGTAGHHDPHRGPCAIMAHHHPDVPNLGDVSAVDWSTVEPVDILTGGSPCQDLSTAGKRAGMTEGTRSNLWVAMREAIAHLRPGLVVWENVRGAYSAAAHSDVEQCPGCLGDRPDEPPLRALGRVLGDLSDLGYDARWHGLRAADVGAPHGRFRVFVVAYPAGDTGGVFDRDDETAPHAKGDGRESDVAGGLAQEVTWPASNRASDSVALLPAAQARWGDYALAISRWAQILGCPAPTPTQTSPKGNVQLAPAFAEWMMGLPAGHVTNVPISRMEQLKALGNGVVPQQAEEGIRACLSGTVPKPREEEALLLPTPTAFHAGNTETPDEWRTRRADVFKRTGTRHGAALSVIAQSIAAGDPLTPDRYMPDED